MRAALALAVALAAGVAWADGPLEFKEYAGKDTYSTSNCMGCHGQSAMGGLGGPIAQTKIPYEGFLKIVREGKGMMPGTPATMLPDPAVARIYQQLQEKPYDASQIPIAFKVGEWLKTKNTARIFLGVFGLAFVIGLWRLGPWLRCTGLARLWPDIVRFGLGSSAWVVLKSLVVDGLLVQSLWKASKHRWLMHGLMLYGFLGLILADILMSFFNPGRGDLALLDPLKLLPMVSGTLLLFGVAYVMYRYRSDPYIDNGLTLGGDFLFVNLLFHTTLSGFLTVLVNRLGLSPWVMPVYIYHLLAICGLILTGPFSRFQHAWVVPILAAATRLTEAVTASGVNLGFEREPSPGRHHKSEAIAASVLASIGLDPRSEEVRLRYYP